MLKLIKLQQQLDKSCFEHVFSQNVFHAHPAATYMVLAGGFFVCGLEGDFFVVLFCLCFKI